MKPKIQDDITYNAKKLLLPNNGIKELTLGKDNMIRLGNMPILVSDKQNAKLDYHRVLNSFQKTGKYKIKFNDFLEPFIELSEEKSDLLILLDSEMERSKMEQLSEIEKKISVHEHVDFWRLYENLVHGSNGGFYAAIGESNSNAEYLQLCIYLKAELKDNFRVPYDEESKMKRKINEIRGLNDLKVILHQRPYDYVRINSFSIYFKRPRRDLPKEILPFIIAVISKCHDHMNKREIEYKYS